jgi:tetratricopeptide (TPR) repeat protein
MKYIHFCLLATCLALVSLVFPRAASAFNQGLAPWVGCRAQGGCGGGNGGGGNGGGNAAPQQQYTPPSPAQQATAINELGNQAFNSKDYVLAERYYRQAFQINPNDPVILSNVALAINEQGSQAYDNKDFVLAERLYRQALQIASLSGIPPDPCSGFHLVGELAAVEYRVRLGGRRAIGDRHRRLHQKLTPLSPH